MDGQQRPEYLVQKLLRIRRVHWASSAPKGKVEELLHNLVADYAPVCSQGFGDQFLCALRLRRLAPIEGVNQNIAVQEVPTAHLVRPARNAGRAGHSEAAA